jgi:hypothetical protein
LVVATCETNTVDNRPNIPAVILFPALLTPNLHVRGENGGMIEILVAAPKSPALTAEHVNHHLKFLPGLDAEKIVPSQDLCPNVKGKIIVTAVTADGFGQLKTGTRFRGILHKSVTNWLPEKLDAFYAIQIHESCLPSRTSAAPVERSVDYQDYCIHVVLTQLNGEALRGQDRRGTHEFVLDGDGVNYSKVNPDRPIVAYHPLYVYPAESLREVTYGHVSDMHLNARQRLFQRSPARVIDAPDALSESPPLGPLVSVFDSSFKSIIDNMHGKIDVLLVGGDLIEHVDNAYPYADPASAARLNDPNAADIWALVDVGKGYERNYQAYVDFIGFFTTIRNYCAATPAFVIAGNHDCYKRNRLYGISPRALGLYAANEGIPADHNLTFYEAILLFGESWPEVSIWPLMSEKHLEWFFAVLTPFSDFRQELPSQNLVGLQWGGHESRVNPAWFAKSGGQGFGHLGRANDAVTENQLALLHPDAGAKGKTVLMTHFTLVSYLDEIACGDGPVHGHVDAGGTDIARIHLLRKGQPYSHYDWGTFEQGRAALYGFVERREKCAAVITGHSHRKGLYFLGEAGFGNRYPTEAHALRTKTNYLTNAASKIRDCTPILVSDCGGPLPRLNLEGEFAAWGSDAPSGTLMTVSPEGVVTKIEVVPSVVPQAKPRLAVALDYLHVMANEVFDTIEVKPFERARAETADHEITFTFHEKFPDEVAKCLDVVLFGRPTVAYEWRKIVLEPSIKGFKSKEYKSDGITVAKPAKLTLSVPKGQAREFYEWLALGPRSGRFVSIGLSGTKYFDKIYDTQSRWNFAVEAKPLSETRPPMVSGVLLMPMVVEGQIYEIMPRGTGDGGGAERVFDKVFRPETPDFVWRRQATSEVYGDKRR